LKAHPKQLWDSGIGGLLKPGKCEFAFTVVANTYDDAGFPHNESRARDDDAFRTGTWVVVEPSETLTPKAGRGSG
jgi:hypothetical protein